MRLKRKHIRLTAENKSLFFEVEALRRLNSQLHLEWANKFLCERKITPLDPEIVYPQVETPKLDLQDILSPAQLSGYLDMKEKFWKDGAELGFSEAEILKKWEEVEPEVMSNAKFLYE